MMMAMMIMMSVRALFELSVSGTQYAGIIIFTLSGSLITFAWFPNSMVYIMSIV